MDLIFEFFSVSIDFMHQISLHISDNEHKGPILKHHLCLNLGKKQTFGTKVKKM